MGIMDKKKCNKCKVEYLMSAEYFHRDKGKRDGFSTICKKCRKEYKEQNKEKIRVYQREYHEKYYKENQQEIMSRSNKYYENNREHVITRVSGYYYENKDEILIKSREYTKANREKVLEGKRRYHQENKDKHRVWRMNRKARVRNLPNDFKVRDQRRVLQHFEGACCLTGIVGDIHMDHVLPLNRGGGTVVGNMVPLNNKLNRSKSDSNLFEWFDRYEKELGLSRTKLNELVSYLAEENGITEKEYEAFYNDKYAEGIKGDEIV